MANPSASAAKAPTTRSTRSKGTASTDVLDGSAPSNEGQNGVTENGANEAHTEPYAGKDDGKVDSSNIDKEQVPPTTVTADNATNIAEGIDRPVTPPPLPVVIPATPQTPTAQAIVPPMLGGV
ncbi:hypothetical protein CERSUDRAFT_96585 [Gelatoporia subvermispora B]|uniref:Uncharacterized protein n=1 Tax=Ceriporiopsis subvermispora (strain B) TaxID=914234 RepID=M2PHF4_CERS8|nr:hypothetical protein CERSUDRAFT_96585 [Gelatoporia subvermispora B]